MAVERVRLALGRAAAQGAGRPHELVELRERVAGPCRRDLEWQQHGKLLLGQWHRAVRLAVDDRDRRAPRALTRDREIVGLVADRRPRRRDLAGGRRPSLARDAPSLSDAPSVREAPSSAGRRSAITSSVRSCSGIPNTAVAPKRPSTPGEISTGRGGRPRAPAACGRYRPARTCVRRANFAPGPRAELLDALANIGRGRPRVDLRMLRRDQHEPRLRERVGVRREHGQARRAGAPGRAAGSARPRLRRRGRARSAGWPARPRPICRRRRARRAGGRSPPCRRSRAGTRSGARSGEPGCGSASRGRPRPGSWQASSGRCRTSRRCRSRGTSPAWSSVRNSHCDQRYMIASRAHERLAPSRRRSRGAQAVRSCARRNARPTRSGARRRRLRRARRAGRRRRSRRQTAPRPRVRARNVRRHRRSSRSGRGRCGCCPR